MEASGPSTAAPKSRCSREPTGQFACGFSSWACFSLLLSTEHGVCACGHTHAHTCLGAGRRRGGDEGGKKGPGPQNSRRRTIRVTKNLHEVSSKTVSPAVSLRGSNQTAPASQPAPIMRLWGASMPETPTSSRDRRSPLCVYTPLSHLTVFRQLFFLWKEGYL